MSIHAHGDFETKAVLDLKEVGLHRYARDPDTDVWCKAWALGNEEPIIWTPGMDCPPRLRAHVEAGGHYYAHNAPFELEIWSTIMVPRYGWPVLRPEQTYCTMSMAYAMGLPGALEDAALATGMRMLKDAEGRALMLRMTRPRAPIGKKLEEYIRTRQGQLTWWNEPEKIARLHAYCQQDVRVERGLLERLMPLSAKERRIWLLDYKINQRGAQLDTDTVRGAIAMAERVKEECDSAMSTLTGGAAQKVTSVAAIKTWMTSQGVTTASLNKQAVVDLLNEGNTDAVPDSLPPAVRKVLLLRQEAGKASNAKLDVMAAKVGADGRLRQLYQYHGAGTGRWAGRGVQVHNMPRDMPKAEVVEKILALVRKGDWRAIDMIYGPPLTMLSRCIRSFFVPAQGRKLVTGDFANIEGRGQAWFAGEDWKIKAYIAADNKTGPGLYELAYSRMFNVPVESVQNPSEERQIGKVSELAFGYQGGLGSFYTMAKAYPDLKVQLMADETIDGFKEAWRDAHPAIAGVRSPSYRGRRGGVWNAIQTAAINAVLDPGVAYTCGLPGRHATYKVVGSFLWCLLPSGRAICYPFPKVLEGDFGPQLTYMAQPSQDDRKKKKVIHDKNNAANWCRLGTYGGALFNNIIQGLCRDFLADLLLALDDKGADISLHTHDSAALEVDTVKAAGARGAMETMMRTLPSWAAGFPLFAECDVEDRFRG